MARSSLQYTPQPQQWLVKGDSISNAVPVGQVSLQARQGEFGLYWQFAPGDPGYRMWGLIDQHCLGSYCLVLNSDGSLAAFAGDPPAAADLDKQFWSSNGFSNGNWQASIPPDGNFRISRAGAPSPAWNVGVSIVDRGNFLIFSQVNDNGSVLFWRPPDWGPGLCIMDRPSQSKPLQAGMVWRKVDIVTPDATYFVLYNAAANAVAGGEPTQGGLVGSIQSIRNDSLLLLVDPGDARFRDWFGIRPISGGNLHFNVAGDSYPEGTAVIMWPWSKSRTGDPLPNFIWQLQQI